VTRLVRIELLKLRTVRLPAGLLVTAAGLAALFACVEASQAGRPGGSVGSLATAAGLRSVTTVSGWVMLFAAVLGVTISTGEFRHATAALTYLATPARGRVLAAKAIAAACAGALFGLVAAIIATGAGLGFAAARGDHGAHGAQFALGAGTLAAHVAGAVLGAALLAALGVGLGSLVRSQLAGIVGVFVWALIVESVIGGIFTSAWPYLPFTAATGLAGVPVGAGPGVRVVVRPHRVLESGRAAVGPGVPAVVRTHAPAAAAAVPGPLPFAAAVALLAGTVIVLAMLARLTTVRRDVA
jgi:ABC-2 type transport system permease protein